VQEPAGRCRCVSDVGIEVDLSNAMASRLFLYVRAFCTRQGCHP
jgi:hypothetical protein